MTSKMNLLSINVKVAPEMASEFIDWQAELHNQIAMAPGFISLEILSPNQLGESWNITERFHQESDLKLWKESAVCIELMLKLKAVSQNQQFVQETLEASNIDGGVTEIFITYVTKNMESIYKKWIAKIHHVEAQFKGFRGVYVQSPSNIGDNHWVTFLKFDTVENLDAWLKSTERKHLLKESLPLVSLLENHRIISPYGSWFPNVSKAGINPPVWKETMLILLVLFPLVMLQLKFLGLLTKGWDISLATFLGNAISASLISWPFLPLVIKLMKWWLLPRGPNPRRTTMLGVLLLLLLYSAEVAFFWSFT